MLGENEDRRIFERIRVKLPLRYLPSAGTSEAQAQTFDISASGLGLVSDRPLADHTTLEMWLEVPDQGQPLYTTGEVVWSMRTAQNQYRMGIDLDRTDLMGVSRILRTARSR